MQTAIAMERPAFTECDRVVSRQKMPLSFLRAGESAKVAKIRDKGDIHRHLENLGFVEGAEILVVSENQGNLIIQVKGTQVAIDRSIASRIITQ